MAMLDLRYRLDKRGSLDFDGALAASYIMFGAVR